MTRKWLHLHVAIHAKEGTLTVSLRRGKSDLAARITYVLEDTSSEIQRGTERFLRPS
jgi:hypothetical protein